MAALDRSLIAGLPLAQGLSPEDLDRLLAEARSARFPKGSIVFEQDEEAHSVFVLLHGHLRVTKVTPAGAQVVVRFVSAGELFGIAQAMGRTTYPATVTAMADSVALVWPAAIWPRLYMNHPSLATTTMQTIGNRLQEAQTRVVEMSTEEVERRVAHALLRLAQQSGRKVDQGIQIDFAITRQDVAEMTGTTLHTVSRILSAWEAQGWVEGGRQKIVVKEPHTLFTIGQRKGE